MTLSDLFGRDTRTNNNLGTVHKFAVLKAIQVQIKLIGSLASIGGISAYFRASVIIKCSFARIAASGGAITICFIRKIKKHSDRSLIISLLTIEISVTEYQKPYTG